MATALVSPVITEQPTAAVTFDPAAKQVALEIWQPAVGDRFVVDTMRNEGFLVHTDGRYVEFPIVTGQRRYVCYIGRCYNASTPNWDWEVQSTHIKGDRLTYGKTGRFLRMYKDGEDHTAYGIHGYGQEDVMFVERDTRFQSMGCVIVRESMLNVIEQTFQLNGGSLMVKSRYGVDDPVSIAFEENDPAVVAQNN